MKKQSMKDKMDESLSAQHGKKKQSMKDRRDESESMNKKMMMKKGCKQYGQELD